MVARVFIIMGPKTFELWFLPTVTLSPWLWLHHASWISCNLIVLFVHNLLTRIHLLMQEMQEMQVWPWVEKIPPEKEMATHSSILA